MPEKLERIESVPDLMLRKPVFRGTRIPVYVVLDLFAGGASPEEIPDEYPLLALGAIETAIAYQVREYANVTVRAL